MSSTVVSAAVSANLEVRRESKKGGSPLLPPFLSFTSKVLTTKF